MDRNHWNRNVPEPRVEEWREQRLQKMAARLQLNASKPRTISSSVLGYGNYRQPMPVHLNYRQQHGEGPRFNHAGQSWNSNYNYSGYREHHSPHKQYHHADQRNHGYGHGSYHQQHAQKKGGHFSSHKSLYNDKKSSNKLNKRYSSSCNNMISRTEVGNQNVTCPEQTHSKSSESEVLPSLRLETNVISPDVNSEDCDDVKAVVEDGCLNVEREVEKASDRIEGSYVPELNKQDNAVSDTVENLECNQNQLHEPQSSVVNCSSSESEIISDITLVAPPFHCSDEETTSLVYESSTIATNIEIPDIVVVDAESDAKSISVDAEAISADAETIPADPKNISTEQKSVSVDAETISVNAETISVDAETISVDAETISVDAETISVDAETISVDAETISVNDITISEQTNLELSNKMNSNLIPEPIVTVPENSTITFECSNVINSQKIRNVGDISEIEQVASESCDITDETLVLELNLSFKSEVKVGAEDAVEAVDPLEVNAGVTGELTSDKHNYEGIGESYSGTSYNESADVFPVALIVAGDSDTEASIFRYDDVSSESDNDLTKEIEHVENKLANISIVNKDDMCSDAECYTPMKRERRQVLLDATNILPSSTIKFAVREVRKNDESEIIVTPVRRSARLSTLTPISTPVHRSGRLSPLTSSSAHKNICVQNLEELSPEIIQKMKFVQNPAIDNAPEL